jgi:hypothetical protein
MRRFYFVGGPTPGSEEFFFSRLEAAGGLPAGWSIYPHVAGDGRALHIARVESPTAIAAHLALFTDVYQFTEPVEVIEARDGED